MTDLGNGYTWDETTGLVLDSNGDAVGGAPDQPTAMTVATGVAQSAADHAAREAGVNSHRDRLGSDLALTRLREIRDSAATADTATLRDSIRDLAKWCLEAAKWESQRGADEG